MKYFVFETDKDLPSIIKEECVCTADLGGGVKQWLVCVADSRPKRSVFDFSRTALQNRFGLKTWATADARGKNGSVPKLILAGVPFSEKDPGDVD